MRILVSIMLLVSACALNATPIYVDFAVKQSSPFGDTQPGVYTGTWSFDDSLVKPGAIIEDVYEGHRLGSFSFSWLGEEWNPLNARLARIEFDEEGKLRSWIIGGQVVSGGCGAVGALDCVGLPTDVTDFYLAATRLEPGIPPPELVAVGVQPRHDGYAEAHGSFTVRSTEVPTPSSLPLFGSALLVLVAFRRRERHRPTCS